MRFAVSASLFLLAACGEPEVPPVVDTETIDEVSGEEAPVSNRRPAAERQPERDAMVRVGLIEQGVVDEKVLAAMRRCPRHRFVPDRLQDRAYWNRPLPIGYDQTISQPTVVGSMTEELRLTPDAKVLEIGTGSGYQAAVLAELTPHVFSIEIKAALVQRARRTLRETGYKTIRIRHADGYWGWPEEAPFDAIVVTAAAPHVPPPLVKQLKPGGRLVIPVGPPFARQDLVLVTKDRTGKVTTKSLYGVAFVPLTGSLGKQGE